MGCDIHMVLERRHTFNDGDTAWVGINDFDGRKVEYSEVVKDVIEEYNMKRRSEDDKLPYAHLPTYNSWEVRARNYPLFGKLSDGVRGHHGITPRTLPDDLSDLARMEIEGWASDAHSFTWLTLREALPHFGAAYYPELMLDEDRHDKLLGKLFEIYLEEEQSIDDYRLIIWFDN
jgi:hypothetical protein